MERPITGYHQDEFGDWVAELDCGHGQHVRHKPPFFNRPWVVTEAGRRDKLGFKLNCVRCDRLEMPADMTCFKRTSAFDENTVPAGLLKQHTTRRGSWGRIVVTTGEVGYRINDPLNQYHHLSPDVPGLIPPEVPHHLEIIAPVNLYVEFYRQP